VRRTPQRLIALALVFAAGLLLTVLPGRPSGARADNVCTPDASWGTVNSSFASQVVTLVNQHRASIGEGSLGVDGALTRSAVWKSMNMAGLNYFDHNDDPIGRTVAQRLVACGWPANQGWGENIAEGFFTPADVMNAWLNSPGHKANIENAAFTSIGVGVAESPGGVYYWTQDFGQGSGGSPPPTTTAPPPPATTAPPPATTAPTTTTRPTTTTAPPTTTAPTTTAAAAPAVPPAADSPPTRVRSDTAVPKVHKAKKAKRVRRAQKTSRFVLTVPRGYLNLQQLRHL
jgi:uncharacterized protein YkwD